MSTEPQVLRDSIPTVRQLVLQGCQDNYVTLYVIQVLRLFPLVSNFYLSKKKIYKYIKLRQCLSTFRHSHFVVYFTDRYRES